MKAKMSIRFVAILLIAAFSIAFISPARANDEKNPIPVELKFVGKLQSQPLFHLVFTGTEENEYTIVVRDVNGNVFYRETVKGTSFVKKFLVKTDDLDETELKFEISTKDHEKPVVFTISNSTQYIENFVVNKLK
jgi:hypothetical protein